MQSVKNRIVERVGGTPLETQEVIRMFVMMAADQGIPVRIVSGFRKPEEQDALYAQGRESLDKVNFLRLKAGMPPISRAENKIVTNASSGHSKHEEGKAFDVVPMSLTHRLLPDWMSGHWAKLGEIGKSLGLKWGGDWTKPDRPHFELP